jgi:SAM-dependent methyltransferase
MRRLLASLRRRFLGEALAQIPEDFDVLRRDIDVLRRDIEILRFNVKNFGYRIARDLTPSLSQIDLSSEPRHHGLSSKATTQRDLESPWFAYWCKELRIAPIYHRKIWEYAFVLQALFEHDKLLVGLRGLGFGCGEEPVASYLASKGLSVVVTDLDPSRAKGLGWMETGQHTSALEQAYKPELLSKEQFERLVRLEYVDMNDIPHHLDGSYDFCWSICAFEHLGSIDQGLHFVEQAMSTLKPGGLAVHTTEFNYLSENDTVDHRPVVLFLKKHFVELKMRLERAGHLVRDLDFDLGAGVLDGFIDVPPYAWDERDRTMWGPEVHHLKLGIDGFPCTCFGLIIEKVA